MKYNEIDRGDYIEMFYCQGRHLFLKGALIIIFNKKEKQYKKKKVI